MRRWARSALASVSYTPKATASVRRRPRPFSSTPCSLPSAGTSTNSTTSAVNTALSPRTTPSITRLSSLKPRLFVEAKALSVALDRKSASQVLGYASTVGVSWCLLTNGDEYRLYKSHASVDVDEKLLRTVRLSDSEQAGLCLETLALIAREQMGDTELELLWKSQFVDRRVKATIEQLFAEENGPLAQLVRKHSAELSLADVRESLRRASVSVHFPEVSVAGVAGAVSASGPSKPQPQAKAPIQIGGGLADLIDAGLIHPPLSLGCTYKGVRLDATVEADGSVRHAGNTYDSLSSAGAAAKGAVVGGGKTPATNGWDFWRYRDSVTGELRPIGDLRQKLT